MVKIALGFVMLLTGALLMAAPFLHWRFESVIIAAIGASLIWYGFTHYLRPSNIKKKDVNDKS
jgi:hypothetical protein